MHDVIQVVSWIDWLENGVTVRGYDFDPNVPLNRRIFSRSQQGLMKENPGGMWQFRPTKLFERTAKSFNIEPIKNGFIAAIQRIK